MIVAIPPPRFGTRSATQAPGVNNAYCSAPISGRLYPAGKSSLLRSVSVLGPISRRAKADTLAVISGTRQQCNLQVHTAAAAIVGKHRPLIGRPRRCGNERKSRGGDARKGKEKNTAGNEAIDETGVTTHLREIRSVVGVSTTSSVAAFRRPRKNRGAIEVRRSRFSKREGDDRKDYSDLGIKLSERIVRMHATYLQRCSERSRVKTSTSADSF